MFLLHHLKSTFILGCVTVVVGGGDGDGDGDGDADMVVVGKEGGRGRA